MTCPVAPIVLDTNAQTVLEWTDPDLTNPITTYTIQHSVTGIGGPWLATTIITPAPAGGPTRATVDFAGIRSEIGAVRIRRDIGVGGGPPGPWSVASVRFRPLGRFRFTWRNGVGGPVIGQETWDAIQAGLELPNAGVRVAKIGGMSIGYQVSAPRVADGMIRLKGVMRDPDVASRMHARINGVDLTQTWHSLRQELEDDLGNLWVVIGERFDMQPVAGRSATPYQLEVQVVSGSTVSGPARQQEVWS